VLTITLVSCIDPRAVPENFFGPNFRAPVFRNAGGRVTDDVVRSFNVLRSLIPFKKIVIIHHTDCGMQWTTDEQVKKGVKERTPGTDLDHVTFGTWTAEGFEDTIREDVLKLRNDLTFGGIEIRGFALQTDTGKIREIEV
jgi:carbonic anhydrase